MAHHDHHKPGTDLKGKKLLLTILLNIVITASQVAGGFISGSLSLLSDALHNFSDVVSLVVSYIANRLSSRKNTVNQTFGYKRAEIIAAFINTAILIVVAILLIIEAIKRINEPSEVASIWVIALSVASIILNGASVLILKKDASDNMNVKSAYLHLLSDMFTSVAVLAGGLIMFYYQIYWIDAVLTIGIGIYLFYMSWGLLLQALKVLMLFAPGNILLDKVNSRIQELDEIKNLHHVHLWQLNDKQIHFEAHVDFKSNLNLTDVNGILQNIKEILHHEFEIDHVTLQPEFNVCDKKDLIAQDQ
jgi:cobalt-zinc-cadmium efflux system protein